MTPHRPYKMSFEGPPWDILRMFYKGRDSEQPWDIRLQLPKDVRSGHSWDGQIGSLEDVGCPGDQYLPAG